MAKIKDFAEELIIKRMRLENPWWDTAAIPQPFSALKPRLYFDLFYKQVTQKDVRRATVLMGPRRVGKTVMLYQAIAELIKQKTAPRKICYLSIDAPVYNNIGLEKLFEMCRTALNDDDAKGYIMIFDEIQYLKDWERHLKSIVDFYPATRFIVSGSAAAALKLKSNESGAGRFSDFMLPPLTFQEYLHLKDLEYLIIEDPIVTPTGTAKAYNTPDIDTLNEHFINYINFGGYPEVIFSDAIQQDPGRFIRSDIIDKVLLRDLPSLYGINDVQELNSLFNVIAYNSGNEINLESLSQSSGVSKATVRKYLEYLEAAFLVKLLYPVGVNTKRFQRDTRFKIYLTNPSMRCALFAPITAIDDQFGQMVETAIVAQYLHWPNPSLYFAAWQGGEVDLVMVNNKQKPDWAFEIKWSNQYHAHPEKLRSLIKFCKENKLKTGWVTTISKRDVIKHDGLSFIFYQAACYCYAICCNSLKYGFNINNQKM